MKDFVSPIGIEFTYQAPKSRVNRWIKSMPRLTVSSAQYALSQLAEEKGLDTWHISPDGDDWDKQECAIEIATPILYSPQQLFKWYDKWNSILQTTPFKATWHSFYKPGQCWYGSGGGHIHATIPFKTIRKKALFLLNVMRFVADKPWLNWVFNEWCDVDNANSFLSLDPLDWYDIQYIMRKRMQDLAGEKIFRLFIVDGKGIDSIKDAKLVLKSMLWKHFAINYREDADDIEFRFFDAPSSFKQVEDHVDIVTGIMEYCKRMTAQGVHIPSVGYHSLEEMIKRENLDSVPKVAQRLKDFCRQLNLSYERYVPYLKNMRERLSEEEKLT